MPKYEIIGDIFGGAALTIRHHDFRIDNEYLPFDSIEKAIRYAEQYEVEHSKS
jgi:hypothetical protein